MFLTQEDYRKIESWLKLNSKKDTDFDFADSIDGTETVTIVQGNKNKRIFLKDFINEVGNLFTKDLVNVSADFGLHGIILETAIQAIPLINRKKGLVITFEDTNSNWRIYQFIGELTLWNLVELWQDVLNWESFAVDSLLPDEEDITATEPDDKGNAKLKFADKEYNPDSFSGLGHVILRKNLVEVMNPETGKSRGTVNLLYSDMLNKENTVYEIRYNFDLNGLIIIIPNNSILKFVGGSITNGVIKSDLLIIEAGNTQIFDNISVNSHIIGPINVMWFGAKGDGDIDDTKAILAAIDSVKHEYSHMGNNAVYLPTPKVTYKITDTIEMSEHWNTTLYSDTLMYGDRTSKNLLFAWYGEENKPIINISEYSYNENLENISINGRGTKGVIGILLSNKGLLTLGTKYSEYRNVRVINCEKGVVVGCLTSAYAPDNAFLTFYKLSLANNKTCGLDISGGNTGVSFYDLDIVSCGTSPLPEEIGCHIKVREGLINVFGYISAGNESSHPVDSDINMYAGGLRIYGAWSDTPCVPFLRSNLASWASILSAVRHYEGHMTPENTPTSIEWSGPQTLVLEGCYLYNNVKVNAGLAGKVIDLGTRFRLNTAGFTGDEVASSTNSVISLSNGFRNKDGKLPEGMSGSNIILFFKGKKYASYDGYTDGNKAMTLYTNTDDGTHSFLYNGWVDNILNKKAISDGYVYEVATNYNSIANCPLMTLYSAANVGKGEKPTMTTAFKLGANITYKYLLIGNNKITFSSYPPHLGEWSVGDICFNSNPSSGNPSSWCCIVAGSPGTWAVSNQLT